MLEIRRKRKGQNPKSIRGNTQGALSSADVLTIHGCRRLAGCDRDHRRVCVSSIGPEAGEMEGAQRGVLKGGKEMREERKAYRNMVGLHVAFIHRRSRSGLTTRCNLSGGCCTACGAFVVQEALAARCDPRIDDCGGVACNRPYMTTRGSAFSFARGGAIGSNDVHLLREGRTVPHESLLYTGETPRLPLMEREHIGGLS